MGTYFLGIDNGGTRIKAAVFDTGGRQLGSAGRSTLVSVPHPGWAQRDMEEMWQANCAAIRQALENARVTAADIGGVGCTGHGKGLYPWGDGAPAYHGIASTDNRARALVEELQASGVTAALQERTLQPLIPCQPAALLPWLKRNEPEVYASIRWVFEAKDYIRFRLTGEAYAEITDYSGTSLMNLHTGAFDEDILRLLDIEEMRGCLPPVKYSHERCGVIQAEAAAQTGLLPGTPVCGGMFDVDACAVAMGITDESTVGSITGTWSINEFLSKTPLQTCPTTKNSLYGIPGWYLIEESSATSAGNLDWFVATFLQEETRRAKEEGRSIYADIDAAVERTPVSDALFAPFLYGCNLEGREGAYFSGLTAGTTKEDMLRAVFEGVVFSHAYHLEKLFSQRPRPAAVRLCGGAARSAVWVQMFADVLRLPVEVIAADEPGALGCAMTAAVAAQYYPDYAAVADGMTHVAQTVYPREEMYERYRPKFERYKAALACMAQRT